MSIISEELHKVSQNENDLLVKSSLDLLYKICLIRINLESRNEPFLPFFSNGEKRSFLPKDLNDKEFQHLIDILDGIKQPILRARIGDILWCYSSSRHITNAYTAIDSYISLDVSDDNFEPDIYTYWHRATILAKSIKNSERINNIKDKLLNELKNCSTEWHFHKLKIAEIFLRTELDNSVVLSDIADLLLDKKKKLPASKFFNEFEQYLMLVIEIFSKLKKSEKVAECNFLLAQGIEKYGDFQEKYMVANCFYKQALQIYRKIPNKYREQLGVVRKLESLERKITDSGNLIRDELELISTEPKDISKLISQSVAHVKDKDTLFKTLLYFSGVYTFNYQNYIQSTEQNVNKSIFSHIGGFTAISVDGRAIDKIPVLTSNNSEEVIFKTGIKNFLITIQLAVQGCILPALDQIMKDYLVPREFLIELCKRSSIVPDKREALTANALFQGFEGDFRSAIYLLAPQVENMIRQLFKTKGVTTTSTDENGIEHEIGLSALVAKDEAREILGDELWFELQAVFTSSLGPNLRNEVGHGLLDDETSNSIFSVYAWWMILRLIIRNVCE